MEETEETDPWRRAKGPSRRPDKHMNVRKLPEAREITW